MSKTPPPGEDPNASPVFNWGKPSHVVVDREPRRPEEGVALCVRAYDHPLQYKIDIWSTKGEGLYHMRLDGFGHLRMYKADTLRDLLIALAATQVTDVVKAHQEQHKMITLAWKVQPPEVRRPNTMIPEIPELVIAEYFEAARNAALKELQPLVGQGDS